MQLRVAIPTKADKGLEDVVSEVFGKAKTFTIVEVEDGQIRNVQVIDNPATSYEYGSGPIAVKTLVDLKVNYVLAAELGPGASGLLERHGIKKVQVKSNTKVIDAIKELMTRIAG
jgi:predicted Fe-Mo cluster-binding NifX family protein